MIRHIYTLIVDCPERSNTVAHAIGSLADTLLATAEGTCTVSIGTIVPHDGGLGLRPRVWLEEVNRAPTGAG